MSAALTQQRAVEIAREHGAAVNPWWVVTAQPYQLYAICEQYHREASKQCQDCGETNPAEIHTCSPQKQASVEPVAYMQEYWSPDCGPQYEIYKADDMTWRDKSNWTPLYTAPPDAEALRKRVVELEAEVLRLQKFEDEMTAARQVLKNNEATQRELVTLRAEVERLRKE